MVSRQSSSQLGNHKYKFIFIVQLILNFLYVQLKSSQTFNEFPSIKDYLPTAIDETSDNTNELTSSPTSEPTLGPANVPTSGPIGEPTPDISDPTTGPIEGAASSPTSDPTAEPISGPTSGPVSKSPFAYVYLMGGVDPDTPSTYLGFLYNVLASAWILRRDGSEADIVIYLQWKDQEKNNSLSDNELRVLDEMNIILDIQPLYKTNEHFFERLMMEKFHLWKMTQYERIMYFDADVMPLCNTDYIFHASMGPDAYIKPNMIFPGIRVPANGGAFLLEPSKQDHERLQNLIDDRFSRSFDKVQGWGRAIGRNESWVNFDGTSRGDKWDFYAAHVDQGLLWHWMRYEKGTFSAPYPFPDGSDFKNGFNRSQAVVENWVNGELESTRPFNFTRYSCLPRHWDPKNLKFVKRPWFKTSLYWYPFHSDIIHFMEKTKPWLKEAPPDHKIVDRKEAKDGGRYWYYALKQVDNRHSLGVDWSKFGKGMKVQHSKPRTKGIT